MIEIVVTGSTIRHGAKLVGPGSRIVVTEPIAAAFVAIGRAQYFKPPAEAATPAPTEAEALPSEPAPSDEPSPSEATAEPSAPAEVTPEEKPKKRPRR